MSISKLKNIFKSAKHFDFLDYDFMQNVEKMFKELCVERVDIWSKFPVRLSEFPFRAEAQIRVTYFKLKHTYFAVDNSDETDGVFKFSSQKKFHDYLGKIELINKYW